MSENNTNRLVEFSHYVPTGSRLLRLVAIDVGEVAAVQETQFDRSSAETQTIITLKGGTTFPIWETIAEVRRKLGR